MYDSLKTEKDAISQHIDSFLFPPQIDHNLSFH